MRIDCFMAAECEVSKVTPGDTFYLNGTLHMRVAIQDVDIMTRPEKYDRCYVVALDTGTLYSVKSNLPVILADTKVVANNAV